MVTGNGCAVVTSDPVTLTLLAQPQPDPTHPTTTVTLDHLWQWDDTLGRFAPPPNNAVTLATSEPTYILTHGWDGDLDGDDGEPNPCVSPDYAMRAIACAIREASPTANLLAWDWQLEANPNGNCDFPDEFTIELFSQLLNPSLLSAVFFSSSVLLDARRSGENAAVQGQILGASLAYELIRHQGSLGAEVHLIGHSHGGGVMGRAAEQMSFFGHPPDSLTVLDTPKIGCVDRTILGVQVRGCLVDSLQYVRPSTVKPGGRIAVFHYKGAVFGFGSPVTSDSYLGLSNVKLNKDLVPSFPTIAHTWIRGPNDEGCPPDDGWYNQAVWDPGNAPPSPSTVWFDAVQVPSVLSVTEFQDGCFEEQSAYYFTSTPCPQTLRGGEPPDSETPGLALLAHETFDSAASWSGAQTQLLVGIDPAEPDNPAILMSEQGDASFFKDIEWPLKSLEITFDYMFRDPRGEESLTVYLDDEIIYYDNAQTSLAAGQLRSSGATYIGQAAGNTARLTFVVRTDGTPGGSLVLDNLRTWGIIPGDMNGDGKLDGIDIQPFVNAILANSTDPGDLYIADFSGNGIMDALDLSIFVDAMLGP